MENIIYNSLLVSEEASKQQYSRNNKSFYLLERLPIRGTIVAKVYIGTQIIATITPCIPSDWWDSFAITDHFPENEFQVISAIIYHRQLTLTWNKDLPEGTNTRIIVDYEYTDEPPLYGMASLHDEKPLKGIIIIYLHVGGISLAHMEPYINIARELNKETLDRAKASGYGTFIIPIKEGDTRIEVIPL